MNSKKKKRHHDIDDFVLNDKDAPFYLREAYNSLRTNLKFISFNNQYKTILVSSSIPSEGKSSTVINLCLSLAADNKKVLLIEADLRKPIIHRYLRVSSPKDRGLSSVLSGIATPAECIGRHEQLGIDLMLAGTVPPNPSELISSQQMKDLLELLKGSYDYIIIDSPPVNVVSDAVTLSQYCDTVLLAVRQNFASTKSINAAISSLQSVNANLAGVVITQYEDEKATSSDHYSHYYNYYYYYSNDKDKKNA